MSTMIAPEHATPQDGSVQSAAKALDSLLSLSEKEPTPARQPEQSPKKEAKQSATEQAPPAPETSEETSESEAAPHDPADASEAPVQPKLYTVKVDGAEEEVTEEELLNGYSRQKDYTTKTMELARARKEFEEREVSAVKQERAQYAEALGKIEQYLTDLAPQEPDWTQLRQTLSPEGFADAVQSWQDNRTRLNAVRAERERVEAQRAEETGKQWKSFVEDQRTKLIEADPDFGDPTKNATLNDDLAKFAIGRGFTQQEIAALADHRLVLMLRDAMRYQQQQAKAPAVKTKIEESIKASEPGGSKANAPKSTKLDQHVSRLQRSGSVDDAALAIGELI